MRFLRRSTLLVLSLLAATSIARADAVEPSPPDSSSVAPPPAAVPSAPVPPLAPPAARPRASLRPTLFIFGMGYDVGGTKLVTVEMTDGSSQSLSANQGFYFEAGLAFLRTRVDQVTFETAATLGVKGWNAGADNGSIDYLVFPVELVERIAFQQVRFGTGMSLSLSPHISSSGVLAGHDVDLKNSLGLLFQLDWIGVRTSTRGSGMFLGVRYLWQKLEGVNGVAPVDASTIGARLGFEF